MTQHATFWDNIAQKYRAQPISNETAYQYTLDRVASHLHKDDRVLELGCGTGGTAMKLAPFAGHILATDFSAGMIAQANERPSVENVTFRTGDVFDAALTGEAFDAVLGFNLFHLVPDAAAQFSRVHQLLKPGGLFMSKTPCVTDPSAALKWRIMARVIPLMQLVGKAPFVKFLPIAELEAQIERAGFEIVETGNYPAQPPNHFIVARKI